MEALLSIKRELRNTFKLVFRAVQSSSSAVVVESRIDMALWMSTPLCHHIHLQNSAHGICNKHSKRLSATSGILIFR